MPADKPESTGQPRKRMTPEERRQALIAAALDLFNTRPYGDVSIDEIAEAANASRTLIYHYFGGKYGIFLAALDQAAQSLVTTVIEAHYQAPDDWLLTGLRAYLDHVERNPIGFVALVRHGAGTGEDEDEAILDHARSKMLKLILTTLGIEEAPRGLVTALHGWIALVEVSCRDWLPGIRPAKADLYLRDLFGSVLMTAARHDEDVRQALRDCKAQLQGAGITVI